MWLLERRFPIDKFEKKRSSFSYILPAPLQKGLYNEMIPSSEKAKPKLSAFTTLLKSACWDFQSREERFIQKQRTEKNQNWTFNYTNTSTIQFMYCWEQYWKALACRWSINIHFVSFQKRLLNRVVILWRII